MLKHVSCSAKRALQVFFPFFFGGGGGEGRGFGRGRLNFFNDIRQVRNTKK